VNAADLVPPCPRHLALAVLGLALALVGAAAVDAFDEPDGYNGAKFGDSKEIVQSKRESGPRFCPDYDTVSGAWRGERPCHSGDKICGGQVFVHHTYRENKLAGIEMLSTGSPGYLEMKRAFVSRFGPPMEVKTQQLHRPRPGDGPREVLSWTGPTVKVTLSGFPVGPATRSSMARYELVSELAREERLRREPESKPAEGQK
jgi:hypothetical protein